MRIRLLGTGAADGIPGWYSDTEVSAYARAHGGKDVRTRSSALIDGHLKIDLPPDTSWQLHRDGLDARDWTGLVFTHSHDDHLAVDELQYGLHPFNDREYLGFAIYGNATVCARIAERYPLWPIELVETRSFEPFQHMDYKITPIRAKHGVDEDTQNLLVEHEGRTALYATDTGIWEPETWEFLKGRTVHALVLECTEGVCSTHYAGHLDTDECAEVVERLRMQGTLSREAPVFTTHHSHLGGGTHAQLEAVLAPFGISIGFDGLEFEV